MRWFWLAVLVAYAVLWSNGEVAAQSQPAAQQPVVTDVEGVLALAWQAARRANYDRARELATSVLERGDLAHEQRVRALQTVAAVYFPANAAKRDTASTRQYLEQLALVTVCSGLPHENPWTPELTDLYQEVDNGTFVMDVDALPQDTIIYGRRELTLRVCANHRADVRVLIEDDIQTGRFAFVDSVVNVRRPSFRIAFIRGDSLTIPAGEYTLRVTARGEKAMRERRFRLVVETGVLPPDLLQYDLKKALRPECISPRRFSDAAAGFIVGSATTVVPLLRVFRGEANRPYGASAAYAGAAMFLASLLAARIDTDMVVWKDVEYNDRLVRDYRRLRDAELTNHAINVRTVAIVSRSDDIAQVKILSTAGRRLGSGERADTLRPQRCAAASRGPEQAPWSVSKLDFLWPDVVLSGTYAPEDHSGDIVKRGHITGSIFAATLRWSLVTATINSRYNGEEENWAIDVAVGAPAFALVAGRGSWASIVTYGGGNDPETSPMWWYRRYGFQSRFPIGASGLSADAKFLRYRRMLPDIDVPYRADPNVLVTPVGHGGEWEAALEYGLWRGFFLRAGHRVEVLEVQIGNDLAVEAFNTSFVGAGLQVSSRIIRGR